MMPVRPARTLWLLDEGANRPRSQEVGTGLATAIARAAFVNRGQESFALSFHSLFIGLLAAPDTVGEWLRSQFASTGADLAGLLGRRGLTMRDLARMVNDGPTDVDESPMSQAAQSQRPQPLTLTRSAKLALSEAERRAQASGSPPETGHLLLAMLSLPDFHPSDFQELRINQLAWASALSTSMPSLFHDAEGSAPELDFNNSSVEEPVRDALRIANGLAGASLITPTQVLAAVVRLATAGRSDGFSSFAAIAPSARQTEGPPQAEVPQSIRLTADFLKQLKWAQRLDSVRGKPASLRDYDLVTAALLCPDEQVAAFIEGTNRTLDILRDKWFAILTSEPTGRGSDDWRAWWIAAGIAIPGPRRAGYSTETDQGDDKLGVQVEARAFARLILDREVQAPLSIGLLGDWGSGKSFFIEQIKREIETLKQERRTELFTNVIEIEFNAWHASDANLWASLVTTIFDEIWEKIVPSDQNPEVARKQLQQQIEQARGAVHEAEVQVRQGQSALAAAERDLERKQTLLAWGHFVRSIAPEQLKKLANNAGWHQAIDTINDVDSAVHSLAATGSQLRLTLATLFEQPLRYLALPTLLVLVTMALSWSLIHYSRFEPLTEAISKTLTTILGVAGALVAPLASAGRKVHGLVETLEMVRTEYDQKLKEVEKEDPARADGVNQARRELESHEASVAAAKARLGELLNQQATLEPRRRLSAFIQERVQSTQYRSQQGIISLVHKDFRELSKYMKDLREAAQNVGPVVADEGGVRPIDRIVLYVDDLDRCRPSHVVNMLEAVHLLLALDLFVVVVAVDSRWLTRALEVHYQDLLAADDDHPDSAGVRSSTPQSYLEKIFQITFALGPMDPVRFADYVAFLAGAESKQAAIALSPPSNRITAETAASPAQAESGIPPAPNAPDEQSLKSAHAGKSSDSIASARTGSDALRLPPSKAVRIEQHEREWICKLVPLLPTPRIAKRMVNVYRVIKAGKSVSALESFENAGRARSCLLILAILFGRPSIAAELLRALHEHKSPFDRGEERFVEALRRRVPGEEEPLHRRDVWIKLVATLNVIGVIETVAECAREPIEIARYSLVTGHDWHTWNNITEPRPG